MVELRHFEHVEDAAGGAGFGVGGPEHHAWNAGKDDRSRAHRTRLECDVHDRVEHSPAPDSLRCVAQRDHLGVGCGVTAELALVVAESDDLAFLHDYGADRHVIVGERAVGLAEGQPHEVLIAGEEV